ncbi:MAG: primosomal protein N' [Calditrichia bacterium]
MDFAQVIFPIPNSEGFTYKIPDSLKKKVQPGFLVMVPFNNRYQTGIVLKLLGQKPAGIPEDSLKEIKELVIDEPVLTSDILKLVEWIADYYICHLGEAVRVIQSSIFTESPDFTLQFKKKLPGNQYKKYQEILKVLSEKESISFSKFKKEFKGNLNRSTLYRLRDLGALEIHPVKPKLKNVLKTEKFYRCISGELNKEVDARRKRILEGRKTGIRELLDFLEKRDWCSSSEIRREGFRSEQVRRLVDYGLLEWEEREVYRIISTDYEEEVRDVELTELQQQFVQQVLPRLKKGEFSTFLLHGITGSGKTQIYIELIRRAIEMGKTAILLVPEIVLTPQTLARFQFFFGEEVCVLHSRLSAAERREILYLISRGKFKVVIGARSAIFAPLKNIGIIVVDEEHVTSYKQTDTQPRYHARDVAIYRARLLNAVVVLGSATPSFESLYNAEKGIYQYFFLNERIKGQSLPRLTVVNLKDEWRKNGSMPIFSDHLELKIESRLLLKEQVMILQNQRGYAPYLLCPDCGYVSRCKNCDITLTYHRSHRNLVCHYCGYETRPPDVCPNCESLDVQYRGIGTQRVEEEFNERFQHARILRMDQDTTRGRQGHSRILEKFRRGEGDILFGTQMIAKGLDFGRVSLVGVVNADIGLNFPDFRAAERTFQLLVQAAGRAGRGDDSGEVVVQTYDPEHYMFKYLFAQDYAGFFRHEMESRRDLLYPPFSRLLLIRLESEKPELAEQYAGAIARFLREGNQDNHFLILGPSPAPLYKIKNMYRVQILVKQNKETDPSMKKVRNLVKRGLYLNPDVAKWPVKLVIDMDPVDIL